MEWAGQGKDKEGKEKSPHLGLTVVVGVLDSCNRHLAFQECR